MSAGIVIHVGAHKTASTHFQKVLRRQSAMLATTAGIRLFLPSDLRGNGLAIAPLAAGKVADPASVKTAFAAAAEGAVGLILSDENILGATFDREMRRQSRFYPDGHLRVARILDGLGLSDATLCLSVRDPAGYLVSSWSQQVTRRGYVPFDQFRGGLDACTLFWSELLERLAGVPGVARIVVWRFEDYPRIARAVFREILAPTVAAAMVAEGHPAQVGISAAAHAQMDEMHAAGREVDAARVRALRDAFPKGRQHDGYQPFAPEVLTESARYYAEDLDDVARMPGVTLLRV